MRRLGRFGQLTVVAAALVAASLASGYGDRVLAALRAAQWHLDIERAMDAVGVAPGMIVAEAGAGDGYFTLPMARRVGAAGAVYANDISRRSLDSLARSARREQLDHVYTVVGNIDDPLFPRRDFQLIVIVHAFHDFSEPVAWLRNARKYLRPGGVVAIIDRDPDQGAESHFWPRGRILDYATQAGFEQTKIADDISSHLIIVLKPRT
jgi:ubiquinone/menaquinone biosynthesis C-methylase UbiE